MPIPQEAVDRELCGESRDHFSRRIRIYHQFQQLVTEDEKVKFLKKDFGTGGHSPLDDW